MYEFEQFMAPIDVHSMEVKNNAVNGVPINYLNYFKILFVFSRKK